jgi:ketosteroid isomerase-like protein
MYGESPEAAIARARAAFVAALAAGDAASASAAYSDDARLLPPATAPIQGRAAIERFWRAGVDSGIAEVELDAQEFGGRDGIAFELGRYALHVRPPGGAAVVDRGTYVLVHERQDDGTWRRAVEMFSPSEPPAVAS